MRVHQIAWAAVIIGVGLVVATSVRAGAQAADPLIGTWTLDPAQSKFSQGTGPKSLVLTFESTPDGLKYLSDLVAPDGQTSREAFTAKTDGKDYPVAGLPFDTVAMSTQGNVRTRVDKKAGKVVMTYNGTLSADGRTLTVHQTGVDQQGQAVDNTVVFVRKM
ncbi:MAG: hypothetical protein ABJC89_23905 [Acidobacteriota bacterium]